VITALNFAGSCWLSAGKDDSAQALFRSARALEREIALVSATSDEPIPSSKDSVAEGGQDSERVVMSHKDARRTSAIETTQQRERLRELFDLALGILAAAALALIAWRSKFPDTLSAWLREWDPFRMFRPSPIAENVLDPAVLFADVPTYHPFINYLQSGEETHGMTSSGALQFVLDETSDRRKAQVIGNSLPAVLKDSVDSPHDKFVTLIAVMCAFATADVRRDPFVNELEHSIQQYVGEAVGVKRYYNPTSEQHIVLWIRDSRSARTVFMAAYLPPHDGWSIRGGRDTGAGAQALWYDSVSGKLSSGTPEPKSESL
jgi:hypothetical protein